jgi:hypothetical protein
MVDIHLLLSNGVMLIGVIDIHLLLSNGVILIEEKVDINHPDQHCTITKEKVDINHPDLLVMV